MALALAYTNTPQKHVYDVIIISHYDSHGVATAAALRRKLADRRVKVFSKFPETGPSPAFPQYIEQLRQEVEAREAYIIDIPVNVKSPDLHIDAEARLPATQIYHYDHHETSIPFAQRLAAKGVVPVMVSNAVQMAAALGLLGAEEDVKKLAIVGIVADRDPSVLKLETRSRVEQYYMSLANKLDVLVRQPQLVNARDQGELAMMLAEYGVGMLEQVNVDYPPYSEANKVSVIESGDVAILADFERVAPQWQPKTAEEVLRRHAKSFAVFIAPAIDPRTRQQVGWDVRVLKYWLSDYPASAEEIVRDIVQQFAVQGNVVGHGDYVSLRLQGATKEQALQLATQLFHRIEGLQPATVHLVNDRYVAEAVRHDFQAILERLAEIHKQQLEMYREYLELKRKQVQLLEETRRHEYD